MQVMARKKTKRATHCKKGERKKSLGIKSKIEEYKKGNMHLLPQLPLKEEMHIPQYSNSISTTTASKPWWSPNLYHCLCAADGNKGMSMLHLSYILTELDLGQVQQDLLSPMIFQACSQISFWYSHIYNIFCIFHQFY